MPSPCNCADGRAGTAAAVAWPSNLIAPQALSGIRHGLTTGSPIALTIPNRDWENWQRTMAVEAAPTAETPGVDRPVVTRPRPGHADLAGVAKYGHEDVRNVLERASARETASRVAVGSIALGSSGWGASP